MKMKWLCAGMLVMLLCLSVAASAADGGSLVLGFELHHDTVRRTSISSLHEAPAARPATRPQWTISARDDRGNVLWERSTAAPRRFHPGIEDRTTFVVVIPAVTPGTRLTLHDQHHRLRWSEPIDRADLARALQRGAKLGRDLDAARAATRKLHLPAPGSRVHAQLAASARDPTRLLATGAHGMEAAAQPPITKDFFAPGPRPDAGAMGDARASLAIEAAAPLPRPIVQASAVPVPISVVDENGQPPGQMFDANLFRGNDYVGTFPVDPQGNSTLPLVIGDAYNLELMPAAPLVADRIEFTFDGSALSAFVLQHGWLLDVQLRDQQGSPLAGEHTARILGFQGSSLRWFPGSRPGEPGLLRFALPRSAGYYHTLFVFPAANAHPTFDYPVGSLDGDRAISIDVAASSEFPGQLHATDGGDLPPGGTIYCSSLLGQEEPRYYASVSVDVVGGFAARLPIGIPVGCTAFMPAPMLGAYVVRTLQPGQRLDLDVVRGVPVRFVLQDHNAQPIVGDLYGQWDDPVSGTSAQCGSNPCELLVPNDRAVAIRFGFFDDHYIPLELEPQQFAAGSEHLIVVARRHDVSGQVLNAEPGAEDSIRVRVYDAAGNFVVSSLGAPFAFRLPDGDYRFEADANTPFPREGSSWMFRQPVSTTVLRVEGDVVLPALELPQARGEVVLQVDRPCGIDDRSVRIILVAPDGRRLHTFRRQPDTEPVPPRPPGQCASVHRLGLSPGEYAIDVAPLGWLPRRIDASVQAGDTQSTPLVFLAGNRTQVWNVAVQAAGQQPVSHVYVQVQDADQNLVTNVNMNAQGRFEAPFVPGWGVEVALWGPDADRGVRHVFTFGGTPPPPQLRLDQIELAPVPDGDLVRIFGDGDRARRFNIVFVAEGYTDVAETYSDLNGNGAWDGVRWYDLDGSGVYEAAHDWSWRVGDAPAPIEGEIPTAQDEPFVDLNGDGILSLDDPAVFVANARTFMRSLLGSDVWNGYRDQFNAYLLFEPSAQAGHDVLDANRVPLLQRETRFAGAIAAGQLLLELDRVAVVEHALAALPEVDLVVALMHMPIPNGRANAVTGQPGSIVYDGGDWWTWPNDIGPSHEMGHFVAGLCDEYSINAGFHPRLFESGTDLGCANATLAVDAGRIPWADQLSDPFAPLPTLDLDGSIGLFEGAQYVFSGAYRPSFDSTMRNNSQFFNPPSRRALAAAMDARAAAALIIFGSGFE